MGVKLNGPRQVPAVNAAVRLCGLPAPAAAGPVPGARVTRVGETAANFWPLWWADQRVANLSHAAGDYTKGWSAYSDQPPLASARARELFQSGLERYRHAARLVPAEVRGCYCLCVGVRF